MCVCVCGGGGGERVGGERVGGGEGGGDLVEVKVFYFFSSLGKVFSSSC